ncbi:hypothetical protein DSUL_90095 [Desulfovibrionales bacterium]
MTTTGLSADHGAKNNPQIFYLDVGSMKRPARHANSSRAIAFTGYIPKTRIKITGLPPSISKLPVSIYSYPSLMSRRHLTCYDLTDLNYIYTFIILPVAKKLNRHLSLTAATPLFSGIEYYGFMNLVTRGLGISHTAKKNNLKKQPGKYSLAGQRQLSDLYKNRKGYSLDYNQ